MLTIKQIEQEAQRRVREDHDSRIVYMGDGAMLQIGFLGDYITGKIKEEQVLSIFWKDKVKGRK